MIKALFLEKLMKMSKHSGISRVKESEKEFLESVLLSGSALKPLLHPSIVEMGLVVFV